jgi:hypothetical protein
MQRGNSFRRMLGPLVIVIVCGATAIAQTSATQTPAQLQQLVAPIALYPDNLVAQILAASTYPSQIAEADHWLGMQPDSSAGQLAEQVNQQPWDSSVKALTEFPSVLANLDLNLSWTTSLGDAYLSEPGDVLDAVQTMRQRAESAGNLQSNSQERVINEGPTIVVQSIAPDTCYLPYYDPWLAYGAPLPVYPGYIYQPFYGPPYVAFGPAIGLGFFGGFGWGWPAWGFNWNQRVVLFNRVPFFARSPFFVHGPVAGFHEALRPEFRGTWRPGLGLRSFGEGRALRGFGRGGFRGFGRR